MNQITGIVASRRAIVTMLITLPLLLTSCATSGSSSTDGSQWPEKKVELVVPYEPGGGTDISARRFADQFEDSTSQQMVVINKPGGGGTVGISELASASADGYEAGLAIDSIMTLQPKLTGNTKTSYTNFKAIEISQTSFILVAKADASWSTLSELVDAAKKEPGKLRIAAPGNGTTNDLAARGFGLATDTTFTHTPFTGGGIEAVNAVVSGEVELASTTVAVTKGLIDAGELKIVGVLGEAPPVAFPDVSTLKDVGVTADAIVQSHSYIVFPKATPDDVISAAESKIEAIVTDPEYVNAVHLDGSNATFTDADQSALDLKEIEAQYAELLAKIPDLTE